MATIQIDGLEQQALHAYTYGNLAKAVIPWKTSAVDENDVLRFMRVPKGMQVIRVGILITDASNASVTLDVGYELVGGTDDVDYFLDGVAGNAVNHHDSLDARSAAPRLFDEDEAYLTLTVGGAAISEATEIIFLVESVYQGSP